MAETMTPATVPARLAARALERPTAVALEVTDVGVLTLGDWHERSNAAACGLKAFGVRHGDRIVLPCGGRDWLDYAVAYVAVQKVGATAVPVLSTAGSEQVGRVMSACGAVGVVGDMTTSPAEGWCTSVLALEEDRAGTGVDDVIQPDDDAEILYTSGTTGIPKGVVASHANLLFSHSSQPRGGAARRVLHPIPPATLAGQGLLLQPLIEVPHRIIAVPQYADRTFLAAVETHRPTDVVLVPALALSLIRFAGRHDFDLRSVKVVRTMSAPIAPAALEKLDALFPEAVTINMYTTTEAWPARIRLRYDPARPGSVGRSDRVGAIRIVNDSGEDAPCGEVGNVELRLAGAPRRRYADDPGASEAVFSAEGWVRTGDLGYVDSEGYLYLVDRKVDVVSSGGMKISTVEVENAVLEFPGVTEAAACGLPHRLLGEYVAVAIVTGPDFSRDDFEAFLERRLGMSKAPKRIVPVEKLPRNAMGKVVKRELRVQLASTSHPSRGIDAVGDGTR